MIRPFFLSLVLGLAPAAAIAGDPDWVDGVFGGNVANLFTGQTPAIITLVKAHRDITSDATAYLSPCPEDSHLSCTVLQDGFILDYIAALYNDHDAQNNVAATLAGGGIGAGDRQVGITLNRVEGCAWRIAILISGGPNVDDTDFESYKNDCESLSAEDQANANNEAQFIKRKIQSHMAHGTIQFALVDDFPGSP